MISSENKLREICAALPCTDETVREAAFRRLDCLTKPTGSLGLLEETAARYAAARGELFATVEKPSLLNFAADHGVAEEGVSAYPQSVTAQMVENFSRGGAAINVLTSLHHQQLILTDVGVIGNCVPPNVRNRKVRQGSRNMFKEPALTRAEVLEALSVGMETALETIAGGSTLIATGEMGIANTTPAAALVCALLSETPDKIAGYGTGIHSRQYEHKLSVIRQSLERHARWLDDPLSALCAVGGLDIAAMCGAVLGAVSKRVPVVTDGFISCAAALAAVKLAPQVKEFLFFGHCSAELGHERLIRELGGKPLLRLDMRLGEGTGASLAIPLVSAASTLLTKMATFKEANVCADKV